MSITTVIDEFDKLTPYEQQKVYSFWHRFLELHKALEKAEIKRTLLTQVFASSKSTTIKELRTA